MKKSGLWLMALLLFLAGCGKETKDEVPSTPAPTLTSTPAPSPTPTPAPIVKEPEIPAVRDIALGAQIFPSNSTSLVLQGLDISATELQEALSLFPSLERVELYDCPFTEEELLALQQSTPALLCYKLKAFGREWDSTATEIDLSNIPMTDTLAVEELLPQFPLLEKVIMCHCGLSDQTMDQLNQKYQNIRFVWMIRIISSGVRTDITYYIPYNAPERYRGRESTSSALRLGYCPDLEAVDLGHMSLMNEDIAFLAQTPKVRYLILVYAILPI